MRASTIAGPPSPLVMLHGAFCGPWVFDSWREKFDALGYRSHAPSLRHHDCGDAPPEALGATSMLDYVQDLETFLDGIEGEPVLIGHSLGGLLAQMLAARRPVRALILLAPSPPWGVLPATPFEYASAQALYLAGDFWNKRLWPAHWVAAANALDNLPEAERHPVLERFVPESGLATFEIMQWPLDMKRATFIDPKTVTCPILCLVGSRDRVNSPGTVRSIAQRYRNLARFEEVAGHSHWLLGEPGWEKLFARVYEWLGDIAALERRDVNSSSRCRSAS